MARGFSETLFAELDKRWAREQQEMDRQSQAIQREADNQFREEQAKATELFRRDQLSLQKEEIAQVRQQRELDNRLRATELLTSDKFQAAHSADPSAVNLGGGLFGKPVSAERQAEVKFERQFQQKVDLLDRFATMQAGGDPEVADQIKRSERGVRFLFGSDAFPPNLTTDQVAGKAMYEMYLNPEKGEPNPQGALDALKNLWTARAAANPSSQIRMREYENEIAAQALVTQALADIGQRHQMSGFRAGFAELSEAVGRAAATSLEGIESSRRSAIEAQAIRLAQMAQGGAAREQTPPQSLEDAMGEAILQSPMGQEMVKRFQELGQGGAQPVFRPQSGNQSR